MSQNTNTTNLSNTIRAKRLARIMAVQSMYSVETREQGVEIDEIVYYLIESAKAGKIGKKFTKPNEKHLIELVRGTYEQLDNLDQLLEKYLAKDWKFDRLGKVIRSVLRMGAYELVNTKDLETPVIVNEYLEIARLFNHEGEVGFINSVLDNVAKEVRPEEAGKDSTKS